MRTLIFALLATTLQFMAADPRLGTWKLISANSTEDPPRTATNTADGDGFRHVNSNGMALAAKYDGRSYPIIGVPIFDHVAYHRTGTNEVMVFYTKDGAVIETDRLDFSSDGNEMVETNSFILPSRPDVVWVHERTGGDRNPANPPVGQWTRDFGKSRLRQGLILRIEPDGNDGVHFTGDTSYTAKPDGKDYPVKDSRWYAADAVALQFVDAHTVTAVYKQDGKITNQDRFVVSPDGKRMTVTSEATRASGVHLHEELVFDKQ